MKLESYHKNGFQIIRIKETLPLGANYLELKAAVQKYLAEGNKNIAFAFPQETFPDSRLIAAMVVCYELVSEAGGKIAVVEPTEDFLRFFRAINLDNIITIFPPSDGSARDW